MNALYYPFHLCHELTLHRLLMDYQQVHFRDFMALQLTPLSGTMAFPDRMGDYYPDLLDKERIVQGYDVSGPMNAEVIPTVNRDLEDPRWRSSFHEALKSNHRFQRGLFDLFPEKGARDSGVSSPSALAKLIDPEWETTSYKVETVQALSRKRLAGKEEIHYEYGFALIRTSAALMYTIRLCHQHHLAAVTDSEAHHALLARTCARDRIDLSSNCIQREGY